VTWQAAAIAVLVLALGLGFAWYERSRPPSRVVALVAALAALAVVGRLAFAPLPNVKPATTDVILFAGYALGSAPGFATGAIAAFVSNFFFEQGAWTPWQMAAWAGVGVGGGVLARVAGRELGRWPLAVACGVAGLAFGAVMDTFQWTLAAHQDAATWIAVSGTSLPYNLAHAVGNFVFCLALGPAFVRSLQRFRRRFEFGWRAPAAAAGAGLALVLGPALAAPPRADASTAGRALSYLRTSQNADGGFGPARGSSSSQSFTAWAALGMAAAGRSPDEAGTKGHSAVDFMRARGGELNDTGELERTILTLRAAGISVRHFGGRDLLAQLRSRQGGNGSFSGLVNQTAFGVLALKAAGSSTGISRALGWLKRQQGGDGGFGFAPHSAGDADDTGAALEAIAAGGGGGGKVAKRAVRYLRRSQHSDGGFGQYAESSSNAQSTAWAVQGLVAAGRNPDGVSRSGRTPLSYLRALSRPDGSIRYSKSSSQTPVWVTAQALAALERKAFPLRGVQAKRPGASTRAARAAQRARRRAAAKRAAGAGAAGAVPVPNPAGTTTAPRLAPAASLRRASDRVAARGHDELSPAVILLLIGTGLLCLAAAAAWRGRGAPLG
jgi:energy-coupling factor transport system substrate-specific component